MTSAARLDRRTLLLAAAASLAACGAPRRGARPSPELRQAAAPAAPPGSLAWALDGPWRTGADRAEDRVRHPEQTLAFFGLTPRSTVVEVWPMSGWWTRILAPYLHAGGGRLYAAEFETGPSADPSGAAVAAGFEKMLAEHRSQFGEVALTRFGPTSGALAPPRSADLVLFFHLDSWMAAGLAEKGFRTAHEALKPGGVLGVVQDRGPAGAPQDPLAVNGLVQEDYVRQLASEAGLEFLAASPVNAASGPGAGAPDRMTLKFTRRV